ncbi:MAG: hypothetical protein KC609_16585 [Myxococcales bacterium]|nr:hypothetical protein [Myxococcales bacterium]
MTRYCDEGGYVVSSAEPIPDEPRAYDDGRGPDRIGCNQLVCIRCGAVVRNAPHFDLPNNFGFDAKAAYESADWHSVPGLEHRPESVVRLYVCHCHVERIFAPTACVPEFEDPLFSHFIPWKCGGHPDGDD